ncbi:MAG: ribonuclease Z [Desulfobacterales bacterium]|jgi:ribonuclease BN (tRNA processing enzyme)|nr:ribonuclease Z [Desulfobacteraceae bacterium]MBT4365050.1 ribonuclease Z [Desulfobacteraceae bacterium]MBT7085900.1 ribonuclease Z [Desulfobacterales bacterium]MBT7696438.1 ribonuclease Z [Desulfobacterales bacterium]
MIVNRSFKIIILGSGTCVPSLKRSSCSVLIETGNKRLLFDSGPGTMRRLLETGVEIFDIDFIFYSHFHPDHTGELASFLFSSKYSGGTRKGPLNVIGGEGFNGFYNGLKNVYGKWVEFDDRMLNIIELSCEKTETLEFDDFKVESIQVNHNDESLAYRITGPGGKSAVYSGDTGFSNNLALLSKDTDILICESSLPDNSETAGHLTPSLAGKIASQANVKKLVLTHFYPECDKVDIKSECQKTYNGEIVLAEDLMEIFP